MVSSTYSRLADLAFYGSLLLVLLLFAWTRIDSSDHLYFVGDGTVIVALVEEMLKSGDWTADVGRIAHTLQVQVEWQPYAENVPRPGGHYFNLSGYIVVATAFCQGLQMLGFDSLSIPFMLRGLNVLLQSITLTLLFFIGKSIGGQTEGGQTAGRNFGLLSMLFFTLLPLAVTEVHYERPESWLACLSALMLFAVLKYPEAPRRSALLMGSALGFSVAVKFSQLFLGIIPFAVLCHLWGSSRASWQVRSRHLLSHGALMAVGMFAAIFINVPFIFSHWPDYLREAANLSGFFDTPNPMYAIEHYSYLSQLQYIGNYFLGTLGITWCLVLCLGIFTGLFFPLAGLQMPLHYRMSLCLPPLFLLFYFALKFNFMDRIFSSTEPMLCILSATGVYAIYTLAEKTSHKKAGSLAATALLAGWMLYTPADLNYKFVQHHIRQPGYQHRIAFQESLKNDFHGFWIKNVHITLGFTGALPEKPEKAPRIYQVEDFHQYWNEPYIKKLQQNGFVLIAIYCSDFAELPASNYTIYHAAAKNHYLVRQDEWPATVAPGYFETNCP